MTVGYLVYQRVANAESTYRAIMLGFDPLVKVVLALPCSSFGVET